MNVFKGKLQEVEAFERKLAKKMVHTAERDYETKLRREIAILVLRRLAELARTCEEKAGDDKLLGRIGRPT